MLPEGNSSQFTSSQSVQFSLMHFIKRLQGSQMSYQKEEISPTRFKSCASQGFTAMTDELLPGRKENFVLKCTNPEQGGRKKKKETKKKTQLSPQSKAL